MQTVKLEGTYIDHNRYLCIVCHDKNNEFCILGVDEEIDEKSRTANASIGLVCKIVLGMSFTFDGDGGFTYHDVNGHQYIFKPVSVQALWTVIQTLHVIAERLQPPSPTGKTSQGSQNFLVAAQFLLCFVDDEWICFYESRIKSPQSYINEWHFMADVLVRRPPSPHRTPKTQQRTNRFEASQDFEIVLKSKLREIMKSTNLDTITSKKIRVQLEGVLGHSLEAYKKFIDKEIMVILGQMDHASKILDYLYLGSEWNASNLEELRAKGITHILNVTREIDNFFPANYKYKNVRVYDEEATDLLKYLDDTYKFIKEAKDSNGKVLVHCKMGISRSATCTISYIMKEYSRDLASTLIMVKERRSIVNPNKSFIKQLEVYEGILAAIRNRHYYHTRMFRSKSESSLLPHDATKVKLEKTPTRTINVPINQEAFSDCSLVSRPKSWSPNEKIAHFLMDQTISKSATTNDNNVINGNCQCFDQFSLQLVPSSPVNCHVLDPKCHCNVELELSVPLEPVSIQQDQDDVQTDVIVQSLSQLPIQMRTSNSLLEDLRSSSHGGSVSSSVSSTVSVPTTPIFSLKRRSSVDSAFLSQQSTAKALANQSQNQVATTKTSMLHKDKCNEVLSVKTLANMYDFKVTTPIPLRPCSARLEDNHIFQRMAKRLDGDSETDC